MAELCNSKKSITSVEHLQERFLSFNYLLDPKVATIMYLAINLGRPLLIEGPPGVGKTELAKIFAQAYSRDFYRLQCYEGLDESKALYEWDYQKQLLCIQSLKSQETDWQGLKSMLYNEEFILSRPLLQAITNQNSSTLLIDELDKSDEEFEALLLELLAEFAISIPQIGTIKASSLPAIFLTSNGTRELSEPLKRRCVHVYLEYPSPERELEILGLKCPGLGEELARDITGVLYSLRHHNLRKPPSIAEAIHWADALQLLGVEKITRETFSDTIGFILKNQEDVKKTMDKLDYFIR